MMINREQVYEVFMDNSIYYLQINPDCRDEIDGAVYIYKMNKRSDRLFLTRLSFFELCVLKETVDEVFYGLLPGCKVSQKKSLLSDFPWLKEKADINPAFDIKASPSETETEPEKLVNSMEKVFDKLKKQGKLPFQGENAKNAERAAMGCYILGADIGENMKVSAFTSPNNQIFYAIQEIKASGEKPEIAAIAGKLEKCGEEELEMAGGIAALETLMDTIPTSANVRLYERSVLDAYRRRVIFSAMCVAMIQFEKEMCAPDEIINGMARRIDGAEWARDKA